ncbi:MAG: hypothetical protein QM396_06835 [Euryarchaeota archaeon]|jgi:predicted RNA-binding Zn-ribbon protein involved in translation (DUF1610 family)|nr:hypothetical protein [Euryarchaeota archaeon]HHT18935.1 hypothetical protein [Methanobacterium sp.]
MIGKFLVLNCSITGPVVIVNDKHSERSCPNCGSTDISHKSSNDFIATKQCKNCAVLINTPIRKK